MSVSYIYVSSQCSSSVHVVFTYKRRLCMQGMIYIQMWAGCLHVYTTYIFLTSMYDERWATLHKQACKLLAAPPPHTGGGLLLTSCCAFAACPCFQVTSCILRSLSACLLDLERFSYGRGRSRSLLPRPAMSTLTSCLACTVRLQYACVRPCMCTADRAIPS
jgi:hypothetical protein